MIPKIIHSIWLGDQSKRPTELIQTWINKNPTWEHKLWTEKELEDFDLINKKQFNEINQYCGKADILRYELLYKFGGFYIDADSECIEPLDNSLCNNKSFACWENEQARPGLVANGYLAAEKGSSLMKDLIDQIGKDDDINSELPWIKTGPKLLTNTIMTNGRLSDITIYPSYYFIPKHYTGIEYKGDGKVYAKQYWFTTFGK